MDDVRLWANRIKENVGQVFFGKEDVIDKVLTSLLCGGHVLLEDVPGLGKTVLAKAISTSLGGSFKRIQSTPDLLPNDVLGISIYSQKDEEFKFTPGPINSNVVLVDEINRATPRTQSAFLEAMAEGNISIDGVVLPLPKPFFLIATENPIDFQGTFPLPEAQKDRFFMTLNIGFPSRESEKAILISNKGQVHPVSKLRSVTDGDEVERLKDLIESVYIDDSITDYILDLGQKTRESGELTKGISPRGTIALYKGAKSYAAIQGRNFVVPEDIVAIFKPIINQRVTLKNEEIIKGNSIDKILDRVLGSVEIPPKVRV